MDLGSWGREEEGGRIETPYMVYGLGRLKQKQPQFAWLSSFPTRAGGNKEMVCTRAQLVLTARRDRMKTGREERKKERKI